MTVDTERTVVAPPRDGGLATEYWKQYYEPDEVEEIVATSTTTGLSSGHFPIHVRMYVQPKPAPTVVMAHGMLLYGLIGARLQLPFVRAGFNVFQFDLPGLGQSGGARAGCTTKDIFRAWNDALDFASARFGGPLFAMGIAEDGVTCYYVAASRPDVTALSIHTLFEYGDHGGVHWRGGRASVKLQQIGLRIGRSTVPTASQKATTMIPFDAVFGAPDDGPYIELLKRDPLALDRVEVRFMNSLIMRQRAPVKFEDCRKPIQVLASDKNEIWPYDMVVRNYERLGGQKQLITLNDRPQWWFRRDWHEEYCAHVIGWFNEHTR